MDEPLPITSLAVTEVVYAVVNGGDLVATLSQTTNRFKFMTRADYYATLNAAKYMVDGILGLVFRVRGERGRGRGERGRGGEGERVMRG